MLKGLKKHIYKETMEPKFEDSSKFSMPDSSDKLPQTQGATGTAPENTPHTDEEFQGNTLQENEKEKIQLTDIDKFKDLIKGLWEDEQKTLIELFESLSESEKKELISPPEKHMVDTNHKRIIVNIDGNRYIDRSIEKLVKAKDRAIAFQHLKRGIKTRIFINKSTDFNGVEVATKQNDDIKVPLENSNEASSSEQSSQEVSQTSTFKAEDLTDEEKLKKTHKLQLSQAEVSLNYDQQFENSIKDLNKEQKESLMKVFNSLLWNEKKELVDPTERSTIDKNNKKIINVANDKYLDRSLKKILNANHKRDRDVQFQYLRKGIITKIYIQESAISGNKDIEVEKKGEDLSLFKAPSNDRNKKTSFLDALIRIGGGVEKILGPKK